MTTSKTPTKLNPSVLQMRLNADNRQRFKAVILRDVFKRRSDDLRREVEKLTDELVALTWGATPQARSANKRRAATLKKQAKELSDKGLRAEVTVGLRDDVLILNLGGQRVRLHFATRAPDSVVCFEKEYLNRASLCDGRERVYQELGVRDLTLPTAHSLTKRFWELRDESVAIQEAAEELNAILDTLFGRSKSLGAAVGRWPALADYAPSILSACRELTVDAKTLDARIAALRDGNMSAAEAIRVEA